MVTMRNALGETQNVVLLGGTSDIGLAIVRRLISPTTENVVLAGRNGDALEQAGRSLGPVAAAVHCVDLDVTRVHDHERFVAEIADTVGDLDIVIMAVGVLGHDLSPAEASQLMTVNYAGSSAVLLAVADRLRRQGHGRIVVLSSVAGERARKSNFVYGSSKAGLDAFAQGLADDLVGTGVEVLIVRPGFVATKMTTGLAPAPLATTADAVAEATVAAIRRRQRVVYAPAILRYVFMVLRHLPVAVYRRLPLG